MQIEYTYYEKEQYLRQSIVQALAYACHPDHLKKVIMLTEKLAKHMKTRGDCQQLTGGELKEKHMADEPQQEVTVEYVRDRLTEVIGWIGYLEKKQNPPVVQELVLARRAAEDSRMRLGVGSAYIQGFDPWTNTVEKKV